VADFQRAVPLRSYEAFWAEWWEEPFPRLRGVTWPDPIPWFALSSGTTSGRTKFVPLSAASLRASGRAALDTFLAHLVARPESDAAGGRHFMLGGSAALRPLAPGIAAGDLTGIAAAAVPAWLDRVRWPPPALARLADWEEKVEALATASLDVDVRTLSGVPSWILILLSRVAALRAGRGEGGSPYPRLRLLVHGGVSFAPYRPRFEALLGDQAVDFREVYVASEGFVALQDGAPAEGLRLVCDGAAFLELVPPEELEGSAPRRFWVADAEPGREYAVALTTASGLWAYLLGDVVRLVSRQPPRVTVAGRTALTLTAFGEHLLGAELEAAGAAAASRLACGIAELSVMPVFPEGDGEPGRHLWVVELAGGAPPGLPARLAAALDEDLKERNEDYRAQRSGDLVLGPPDVRLVPPGTFLGWMRRRGKLGGQNKVPRVLNDRALQDDLLTSAGLSRRPPPR
jgi:hypothetical protein